MHALGAFFRRIESPTEVVSGLGTGFAEMPPVLQSITDQVCWASRTLVSLDCPCNAPAWPSLTTTSESG